MEALDELVNDKYPRVVTWLKTQPTIDGEELGASSASAEELLDFFDGVEPPVRLREARVIMKRLSNATGGTKSLLLLFEWKQFANKTFSLTLADAAGIALLAPKRYKAAEGVSTATVKGPQRSKSKRHRKLFFNSEKGVALRLCNRAPHLAASTGKGRRCIVCNKVTVYKCMYCSGEGAVPLCMKRRGDKTCFTVFHTVKELP